MFGKIRREQIVAQEIERSEFEHGLAGWEDEVGRVCIDEAKSSGKRNSDREHQGPEPRKQRETRAAEGVLERLERYWEEERSERHARKQTTGRHERE